MIDKWIYNFFTALDKLCSMMDNLFKFMIGFKMNYYFTGALIIAFVLIALFLQPGYIPR
jgi:hypothetical protein